MKNERNFRFTAQSQSNVMWLTKIGKVRTVLCSFAFMMQFFVTNLLVSLCRNIVSKSVFFHVGLFFFDFVGFVLIFCALLTCELKKHNRLWAFDARNHFINKQTNQWWSLNYSANLNYIFIECAWFHRLLRFTLEQKLYVSDLRIIFLRTLMCDFVDDSFRKEFN